MITRVHTKGRQEDQGQRDGKMRCPGFEEGGRDYMPRPVGSIQKLEKAREWIFPESL